MKNINDPVSPNNKQKWHKHWGVLTIAILTIIAAAASWLYIEQKSVPSPLSPETSKPIPGEVVIDFKKSISINGINDLAKKNGWQVLEPVEPSMYLIFNGGTTQGIAKPILNLRLQQLQKEQIVISCNNLHVTETVQKTENASASCDINPKLSQQDLDTVAIRYRDLEGFAFLPRITIKVPIGQEVVWIRKLQKYPEIYSAGRSYTFGLFE